MRKGEGKKSAYILALLMLGAFFLAFQFGAVGALAQCTTPAGAKDADCDGFSDSVENAGITLPTGMSLAAYPGVNYLPKCPNPLGTTPRSTCVDPATQDLFVILQRATSSCLNPTSCGDPCGPPLFGTSDIPMPPQYVNIYGTTSGPLQWVSGIANGFTTHELQTGGTSQVVDGWYAVKIVEDLNPCSSWMGLSTPGTMAPNLYLSATVWPEKIMNWIDKICSVACFVDAKTNIKTCYSPFSPPPPGYVTAPGTFYCKNYNNSAALINMKVANPNLTPLYNDFIKSVVSHEASHMIHLAFGSGTSADHHWPIAQGVLMEQFIGTKVTKDSKGNINVILYISNSYTSQDQTEHALE